MTTERTPAVSPSLSERELEVLKLVATGATNNQVARDLSISVNTVKVHLNNIFTKLGVQSRTEASLYAVRHGWIDVRRADGTAVTSGASETAATAHGPAPGTGEISFQAGAETVPAARSDQAAVVQPAIATVAPGPGRRSPAILSMAAASILVALLLVYLLMSSTTAWKEYFAPAPNATSAPAVVAPQVARWQLRAPLSSARESMAVTTVNGRIFVVGGLANGLAVTDVEAYDPPSDHWSRGAPKPTAVQAAGAAVIGGRIYVPGGCDTSEQPSNLMEVYDPQSDSWQTGVVMPQALCHYAISALEGKLYIFGGWNGSAAVADVRVFDPIRGEWSLHVPMPGPRMDASAAVVDDRIYVAGGRDGTHLLDELLVFDPTQSPKNSLAWTLRANLTHPRADLALAALAGNLYVVGGGWSEALPQNERFDTRTNSWQAMEDAPETLWRVGGVAALETKIYVIGGWKGSPSATVAEYTALYRFFLPNAPGSP
jgi:DNA-binding CsgD family transcriptional regulator/N-acetylneuraminic acid mutarotase